MVGIVWFQLEMISGGKGKKNGGFEKLVEFFGTESYAKIFDWDFNPFNQENNKNSILQNIVKIYLLFFRR